jgi:hypothetical protein
MYYAVFLQKKILLIPVAQQLSYPGPILESPGESLLKMSVTEPHFP